MVRLVGTIPRVQALFVNPVIVGGLAVLCRLGVAYRSTQDLDTLLRRLEGQPSGLEILERAGATSLDNLGATLPTERGDVRVDVLEARDSDLDRDFTDPTDRLEAMAHRWALATATPVRIGATSMDERLRGTNASVAENSEPVEVEALVARPGPLVAMKLKASVDRTEAKEATDLLDVIRLVTDPVSAQQVTEEFRSSDAQLADDAWRHAELKFERRATRTLRLIRNLGRADVDAELIAATADFLRGTMVRGDSRP